MNPLGLLAEWVTPGVAGNDVIMQLPVLLDSFRITFSVTPKTINRQECYGAEWSDEANDKAERYALWKTATGQLGIYRSIDGATSDQTNSTNPIPANVTEEQFAFDNTNGHITWSYSTDFDNTYTGLGTKTLPNGAGVPFHPVVPVPFRIGNRNGVNTAFPFAGNWRWVRIEAGVDGSGGIIAFIDFRQLWLGPNWKDAQYSRGRAHMRGQPGPPNGWSWQVLPVAVKGLVLPAQVTFPVTGIDVVDPAAPAIGSATLYPKSVPPGGRDMFKVVEGSGVFSYELQPGLFVKPFSLIVPGSSTTMQTLGCTVTSAGTLSHPTASEQFGRYTNALSAATVNAVAGVGEQTNKWRRGSVAGESSGFWFRGRFVGVDAAYASARFFAGLTGNSLATVLAADDPGSAVLGFTFSTARGGGDVVWQFAHSAAAGTVLYDPTTMPFNPQHVYVVTIFCSPLGTIVSWTITDLTAGTSSSGTTAATLPSNTSNLLGCIGVATIDGTARNIGVYALYVEGGTY